MSQTQLLYQLQQLDSEIKEKKGKLTNVLRAQKETGALLLVRKRLKTAVFPYATYKLDSLITFAAHPAFYEREDGWR